MAYRGLLSEFVWLSECTSNNVTCRQVLGLKSCQRPHSRRSVFVIACPEFGILEGHILNLYMTSRQVVLDRQRDLQILFRP